MDQEYSAKYFLDLNFEIDRNCNREKLKSSYIREITTLFKPYILNSNNKIQSGLESDREVVSVDYSNQPQKHETSRRHDTSVSPATNNSPLK
jgi:hypothetical protein